MRLILSGSSALKGTKKQEAEKYKGSGSTIRVRILSVASEIMNRKGFSESNISEIASEAGVKDALIYHYFKGKEDLLFSVVEYHMEKFLLFLDDQIGGISGAYNALRKLVWAHLRYNDVNREYITLLLLECRSNINFYQTRAYQLIRRYAGILMRVLEQGVEEKVFRSDVNLILVRDVIFGLVDFEAITCLIIKEIDEAAPDHDECMRLIDRFLLWSQEGKREIAQNEKRHRILIASIKAFAEKGYNNATISEIAQRAGVADGTVYEYFKNKEELLLFIPEKRFEDHLNELKEAFNINDPLSKLRRFIQHHFNLYLVDKDFLRIYIILILLNRRFYQSRAYEGLRRYVEVLEQLVQEGISEGSFMPDTSIRVFRNMFLGAFTHMVIRWLFLKKGVGVDKMEEINEVTRLFTQALIVKES
jgi:TetR/AcrR family fatty acid metabolism transcriptional regulator